MKNTDHSLKNVRSKYWWYPLLIILSVIFLFTKDRLYYSIFPPGEKYGVAFNQERERLGITILPDTWVTNDKSNETKVWYPLNRPESGSFRSSKVVVVKSGDIVYEGDVYLRSIGEKYEKLTIGYRYQDTGDWEYKYYNPLDGSKESYVTKHEADSILHSWGLKYR